MDVEASDLPCIWILDPKGSGRKFQYEDNVVELTVDSIQRFVTDYYEDKIKQYLKSDPIPKQATVDGLTVVVGKTHDDIVLDTSKDVFVMYYAPWCHICQAVAPFWEEFAKAVEDHVDIVIAKFDIVGNEALNTNIQQYPTLRFYPRNDKNGVDYDDEPKV